MNPPHHRSWLACVLCLLSVALGAILVHAAPEPVDPLVGNWFYQNDNPVTFNADGTAVWNGRKRWLGSWTYLRNPEVQRHYRIIWEQGKSISTLVLAEKGERAHVREDLGEHVQFDVRRMISDKPVAPGAVPPAAASIPAATFTPAGPPANPDVPIPADPADPVLGDWLWWGGRPVTFKADGTVVSRSNPQGIWEYLHNPGSERRYRVTWGRGKSIDTLSYLPGAPGGRYLNKNGRPSDVQRATSANPTPSAPASHPFGAPNPPGAQ